MPRTLTNAHPNFRDRLACLLVLTCAGFAIASIEPDVDESLVDGLDRSRWSERETASEEIAGFEADRLAAVEAALRTTDLTIEQRQRLMNIGREEFGQGPRAAMGISWNEGNLANTSVIIGAAVPGFDCARVLMPGDRILRISGHPILGRDAARSAIISHNPGEKATVEVLRRGEIESFEVLMGSFDDLETGRQQRPDLRILDLAWRIRVERNVGPRPADDIRTGLETYDWVGLETAQDLVMTETQERLARERGPTAPPLIGVASSIRHASRAVTGLSAGAEFKAVEVDDSMAGNAANLENQYIIANNELMKLRTMVNGPGLDQAMRLQIRQRITAVEAHVVEIKRRMPRKP